MAPPVRALAEPLWWAVQSGDAQLTAELLGNGANPGLVRSDVGLTVLQQAALHGAYDVVKVLIAARAQVDDRAAGSRDGETALSLAVLRAQMACAEVLLAAGADPDAHGLLHHGTPLHTAVCSGHEQLVSALLKAGSQHSALDADGFTPLMRAMQQGSVHITALLIENKAEVAEVLPMEGATAREMADAMLDSQLGSVALEEPEDFDPTPREEPLDRAALLPELPLRRRNAAMGDQPLSVLVLGQAASGKTSLILSLLALGDGCYPSRKDLGLPKQQVRQQSQPEPPDSGEQSRYVLEHCASTVTSASEAAAVAAEAVRSRLGLAAMSDRFPLAEATACPPALPRYFVFKDTPALDIVPSLPAPTEPPVSAVQGMQGMYSWLRTALKSGSGGDCECEAVLIVLDATKPPLWEDRALCRDLCELLAALRFNEYTVVLAVTKLYAAREAALLEVARGAPRGCCPGRDPHNSYESYVERYLGKIVASLRSSARMHGWLLGEELPGYQPFPLDGMTVLDAPAWLSIQDFRASAERRGTAELPNQRYIFGQLERILKALSVESPEHPGLIAASF